MMRFNWKLAIAAIAVSLAGRASAESKATLTTAEIDHLIARPNEPAHEFGLVRLVHAEDDELQARHLVAQVDDERAAVECQPHLLPVDES